MYLNLMNKLLDSIHTYNFVIVHIFPRNAMAITYRTSGVFNQTTVSIRTSFSDSFFGHIGDRYFIVWMGFRSGDSSHDGLLGWIRRKCINTGKYRSLGLQSCMLGVRIK